MILRSHSRFLLEDYRVIETPSGHPSVVHEPSEHRIHSAHNPVAEADAISKTIVDRNCEAIVIIGGGLGYLPEAIHINVSRNTRIEIIEFDPVLWKLACQSRSSSKYATGLAGKVHLAPTIGMLSRSLSALLKSEQVIVSPYITRLTQNFPMFDYFRLLRTEIASASQYSSLIAQNIQRNSARVHLALPWTEIQLPTHEYICVVGAGPGLDAAAYSLHKNRKRLALIAASGAVPALLAADIVPDVVLLLESNASPNQDLAQLPSSVFIVAFPFANCESVIANQCLLFNALPKNGLALESRGGSTVIPALDFAFHMSDAPVLIIGVDLALSHRQYASGSKRRHATISNVTPGPVKFDAMRWGLESLIERNSMNGRSVFHLISHQRPLAGTVRIQPEQLSSLVQEHAQDGAVHVLIG